MVSQGLPVILRAALVGELLLQVRAVVLSIDCTVETPETAGLLNLCLPGPGSLDQNVQPGLGDHGGRARSIDCGAAWFGLSSGSAL